MRRATLLLLASGLLALGQMQPFDVNVLMKLARLGEPQISPDGKLVAFTVQSVDVAANKRPKQIWVVPVAGGAPRQITKDGESNERPRWSPDSKQIAFISNRGGSAQVWLMNPEGGDAKQVTNLSTEAGGVLFAPDGKNLVFTSDVFPECGADDACNKKKLDAEKENKVQARIYTSLLYRHWNHWQGSRRSHLLVVPVGGGAARDLTPGPGEVPPFSLGGPDDYAISPDGSEVCYAMRSDPEPAVSTNTDLYVVTVAGQARRITTSGWAEASPLYSPDGKHLAFRSQSRPGYESDRWRLMVLERGTGKVTSLTEAVDRWVTGFTWAPDSQRLFFTAEDRGRQAIQFISLAGGEARVAASGESQLDDMQFTPDGKTMVYTGQSGSQPVELYRATSGGGSAPVAMTHLNDALLDAHQLTPLEDFWVTGAENAQVQSFMVKPYGFRPNQKYPVLFLIHGGPQGAWGQSWTYRWNAQVFAAAGYVVVMPNPRGSTGYGQKFVDEINTDWGGRAFDDIMAAADHVATLPYVDSARMAAAGGSYGGYMVNWILGHTARFKALVSHAGVYDLKSMFGETEELWFPLWEFGGNPWNNPDPYTRWSPSNFVKEFRTPTLVIHGEQDYRVPFGQGLQLFTALQMQKVPSKLLVYPDEGHWVQKPQNSVLWYRTFLEWIDTWTKK